MPLLYDSCVLPPNRKEAGEQFTTAPGVFTAPAAARACFLLSQFLGPQAVLWSPAWTISRHRARLRPLQVSSVFRRVPRTSGAELGGSWPSGAYRKKPPYTPSCRRCPSAGRGRTLPSGSQVRPRAGQNLVAEVSGPRLRLAATGWANVIMSLNPAGSQGLFKAAHGSLSCY
ncbi:hypothetical protein J1605_020363 [Eschrichtius robustus]|uniref:Uncharacterized protein n=1 Tax=Eschrichtius robustus TaxID=9764 RepID=A0AB34HIU7_ESCRO|nr:hypothetical protein J1605_020363 [Eschrichtius robustus]